jgi:hypothetical protein
VSDDRQALHYCALPPQPVRQLPSDLGAGRLSAILVNQAKWVNGTILHYYFFDREGDGEDVTLSDGSSRFVSWVGADDQLEVVRAAFREWKDLGIGLEFKEVSDRSEAEVRIGFMDGDGSWSYVGRGVLGIGANDRTMNFGWDLTTDYGHTTALHEIGHTLGLPHEHQNPFAGIIWDEPKVYEFLGGPPNNWSREQTFHNVLRKLNAAEVAGSSWDPDSIMEYEFPPGLIKEPARFRDEGISPPGTVSPVDKAWVLKWYPGTDGQQLRRLTAFESVALQLKPAEQADFELRPDASRTYEIATFGTADTVMVLFEEVNGELRFVAGDDDSGTDRNSHLQVKLFQGRRYVVRLRLYWVGESGTTAVMYW